ncbi:MAG: permease [Candidatus Heteroscillospira sp.]|jgi:uncharacterized membrane protein YraQ (UPF0718 family)
MQMFQKALYALAILWLGYSWFRDSAKTKLALKKAWKSFENILPSVLAVLLLIGLIMTFLDAETVSKLIGADTGFAGLCVAAVIGSITLIPGFVAMPLAAALLESGAGYAQIAVFISTLMMVGVASFPLEAKYFGRRATLKRNLLSLAVAAATSLVIGAVMK